MSDTKENNNHSNSSSSHTPKLIQPHSNQSNFEEHDTDKNGLKNSIGPAVDLIRKKIEEIYSNEPNAEEEMAEAEAAGPKRSKHQEFMHNLHDSGKPLAEIQTAWHEYYQGLADHEKHEVWQEFRVQADDAREKVETQKEKKKNQPLPSGRDWSKSLEKIKTKIPSSSALDPRSVGEIKEDIVNKVKSRSKNEPAQSHIKSIAFGLSMGALSVLILLFGLFNERIVAPFITPSKTVSNTPIISDLDGEASGDESRIIIPKINVDIPVVYDQESVVEDDFQQSLEDGVVHYATTPEPGEKGNSAIFGHSSNNILNPGKYKFAFVLLNRLRTGDTFILEKGGTRYVYRVYNREVVDPSNLGVLESRDKAATVSLITCDPPGTVQNRLVVVGEQITPDPSLNLASSAKPQSEVQSDPEILPSNAPSLLSRLFGWLGG